MDGRWDDVKGEAVVVVIYTAVSMQGEGCC
jgi:hypothetical protein